jgi:hypothetical protein
MVKKLLVGLIAMLLCGAAIAQGWDRNRLGGVVDPTQVCHTQGVSAASWTEIGPATWSAQIMGVPNGACAQWRVSLTPAIPRAIKISFAAHIRTWDVAAHQWRLFNKLRIVRVLPTFEVLVADSESLWESYFAPVRAVDSSRSWFAIDTAPAVGQSNVYAVQAVAGDGVWTEIAFGSELLAEYLPD